MNQCPLCGHDGYHLPRAANELSAQLRDVAEATGAFLSEPTLELIEELADAVFDDLGR